MVLFLLPEDTSFRWSVISRPPPQKLTGARSSITSSEDLYWFSPPVPSVRVVCPDNHHNAIYPIANGNDDLQHPPDMLNCPLHNLSYATHRGGLERFKTNQTGSIGTGQIFVAFIPWCSSTDSRLYSDPERWQHSGDRIPKSPACWDRHELHCCSLEQVRVLRETQWGSYQRRGE